MQLKCPKCYSEKMKRHSYSENGKQRFSCLNCGFRTIKPLGIEQLDKIVEHAALSKKIKSSQKRSKWVITSAQNATPVHMGFLKTLHGYCETHDAELIVVPFRYKNPTSVFTDKDYEWWDESITQHLIDRRYELCDGVVLLGDMKIQPTAKTPLTGLEGFTGTKSCIVGHPKYQFKTVATRQGELAKIMTTTGAITLPNYTRSRAGKTGHHHHQLAATVVESDGTNFYIRQITANQDGSFTDLNHVYTPNGNHAAPRAASLVLGDLHQWWISPKVDEATFGEDGLINLLRPEKVFVHDSLDGYSISHHARNDPFIKFAKHHSSKYGSIRKEILDFVDFMKKRMKSDIDYIIVPSNHDDHITRFIKETDWREDPENASFYLATALMMLQDTYMGDGGASYPRPFDYWMSELLPDVSLLDRETSMEILGVEHAYHGDIGLNGARGTAQGLSKIGVKTTIGHGHSPTVVDGCYQVGVSTGRMAYASGGPSGWLNTHCVLYSDGKRSLLHIINGKFRK